MTVLHCSAERAGVSGEGGIDAQLHDVHPVHAVGRPGRGLPAALARAEA